MISLNFQFLTSYITLKTKCNTTDVTLKDKKKKMQLPLIVNVENKINTFFYGVGG